MNMLTAIAAIGSRIRHCGDRNMARQCRATRRYSKMRRCDDAKRWLRAPCFLLSHPHEPYIYIKFPSPRWKPPPLSKRYTRELLSLCPTTSRAPCCRYSKTIPRRQKTTRPRLSLSRMSQTCHARNDSVDPHHARSRQQHNDNYKHAI